MDWLDDWGGMGITAFVVLVIIVVAIFAAIHESNEWEKFKVDHKCKVVGYVKGGSNYGVTSSGKSAVVFESDKTSWLCDDGITYTR